jgi:tRNA (guanine-N7-)-methyltransferase
LETLALEESSKTTIKSYVLRQGRMTRAQNKALQELWSEYGLDFTRQVIDLDAVFGISAVGKPEERPDKVLEVGFGMGDSLYESMRQFPNTCFLGIEVHGPGVGHLMRLAASEGLSNLRIYRHDVIEVLNYCIPNNSLDAVQVFFPDPWPKKKHHKRRLINNEFVLLVMHKLNRPGILHLATDWPAYAEQMRQVVTASNLFEIREQGRARPETKYERRAKNLGHNIVDLVYQRRPGNPSKQIL